MRTLTTIAAMQRSADDERRDGRRIALVPTMGALHEGHLSLVREARRRADVVVVSIFVNPIQFNSRQDFELYPRDEAADARLLEDAGVDVLFQPSGPEMYPAGFETSVEVAETSRPLCGAHRPGHFRGVATVVAKLFLAAKPDVAVFGAKDFQQLQVIRRMTEDLNFGIEIVGAETVREPDGLAMSSRNRRLSPDDRRLAARIPAALERVREAAAEGERDPATLAETFRRALGTGAGLRLEYAEARDAASLATIERLEGPAVFAVAVWVGDVRLIDNVLIDGHEAAPAAAGGIRR